MKLPKSKALRALAALAICALWLLLGPRLLAGRSAAALYAGQLDSQEPLAQRVAESTLALPGLHFYNSGNDRFDGQSAIAIYQMTLLGLGQLLEQHPERKEAYLPAMRLAAKRLVDPKTHRYAITKYGSHGAVHMAPGTGHAYLGYINFGLGMLRKFDPETELAPQHDRITQRLKQRLDASKLGMIETYPGETWPPDVAAVAGSIGLHGEATGTDHSAMLSRWAARFEKCAVHETGYLVQRLQTGTCRAVDAPRGSGTAVGAYFVSFAAPELAAQLYRGVQSGHRSLLGFGGVREYAPGFSGNGDVNAGPIVFGVSVGATGFAIGAARAHGDRAAYVSLYRTARLFGAPTSTEKGTRHAVGGALGDALLLAMLTARQR
ncbi:MAG TPA: hypothetical protein PKA88_07560 [Polyangiaceae bacterium]|nr:hypothetical protein [Polyangiaceae bacterium]